MSSSYEERKAERLGGKGSKKAEKKGKKGGKDKKKKSAAREWGETLIFALVVVPLINAFILQSYAIPTSSMEGSMLVGDKLFVSKVNYGPRVPITPLALPFMHDRIWGTDKQSYTEAVKLPYMRLPGFKKVKSGDIVVFNWPAGDTLTTRFWSTKTMKELEDQFGKEGVKKQFKLVSRPVDRRENYVKRCVAAAGDSLKIVDGIVYVNNVPFEDRKDTQHTYIVETNRGKISDKNLKALGFMKRENRYEYYHLGGNKYRMNLSAEKAKEVANLPYIQAVVKNVMPAGAYEPKVFPYLKELSWNVDNFGPIWLPKKGETIQLDSEVKYATYERAIRIYEGKQGLKWENGQAYLNGEVLDSYTFTLNYYWMMGDNRHNSQDSRMWGFVPEDHIVGTPIFVWLSTEPDNGLASKIRWDKSFRIPR